MFEEEIIAWWAKTTATNEATKEATKYQAFCSKHSHEEMQENRGRPRARHAKSVGDQRLGTGKKCALKELAYSQIMESNGICWKNWIYSEVRKN